MDTDFVVHGVKVVERRTFLTFELICENVRGTNVLARSVSDSAIICQDLTCQNHFDESRVSACNAFGRRDEVAKITIGNGIDADVDRVGSSVASCMEAAVPLEDRTVQQANLFAPCCDASLCLPAVPCLAWDPTQCSSLAAFHAERSACSNAVATQVVQSQFPLQPALLPQLGCKHRQIRQHFARDLCQLNNMQGNRIKESTRALPIEPTTILLRNILPMWTRDHVAAVLDLEGFQASYDFVHVPLKFHDLSNVGYALVNLVDPRVAERGRRHFHGFKPGSDPQAEPLTADWNRPSQGLSEHIERYRNSPMMHKEIADFYRPGLYSNGLRIPFPKPTVPIRAPRVPKCKRVPGAARPQ